MGKKTLWILEAQRRAIISPVNTQSPGLLLDSLTSCSRLTLSTCSLARSLARSASACPPTVASSQSQCLICVGIAGRGREQVEQESHRALCTRAFLQFVLMTSCWMVQRQLEEGEELVFVWLMLTEGWKNKLTTRGCRCVC